MEEKSKASENSKKDTVESTDKKNKNFQNLALNFQKSAGTRANFYQKRNQLDDNLDFIEKKTARRSTDFGSEEKTVSRVNVKPGTEKTVSYVNVKPGMEKTVSLADAKKDWGIESEGKQKIEEEKAFSSDAKTFVAPVPKKVSPDAPKASKKIDNNDPLSLVGSTIHSKYDVVKLLGRGGMGIVYLANHKRLNKKRAIKFLPKFPPILEEDVSRFFKEATIAASIEHPNIVQVQDIEETDKFYYIVMEFVEGDSLDRYIHKHGVLSVKQASKIIQVTALGFAAIHNLGLIHRDIKPANFMMMEDGNVKIMDFGIAKDLNNQSSLTGSNIIGTPQFMAPELITKRGIDHRSDIYSLGATFYYLLTGQYCFSGSTMQIIYQVVNVPPIPPEEYNADIPSPVSQILLKMLEKDPEDRFENMYDVEVALKDVTG